MLPPRLKSAQHSQKDLVCGEGFCAHGERLDVAVGCHRQLDVVIQCSEIGMQLHYKMVHVIANNDLPD